MKEYCIDRIKFLILRPFELFVAGIDRLVYTNTGLFSNVMTVMYALTILYNRIFLTKY